MQLVLDVQSTLQEQSAGRPTVLGIRHIFLLKAGSDNCSSNCLSSSTFLTRILLLILMLNLSVNEPWLSVDPSDIPRNVNEKCPYPGYAGNVSDIAIRNGTPKPPIPMAMDHSMPSGKSKSSVVEPKPSPRSGEFDDDIQNYDIDETVKKQMSLKFGSVQSTNWTPKLDLGEVAGVDTDANGDVWVFHRGSHTWDMNAFDLYTNVIQYRRGL